ncbi:hypothetical protein F4810DRAFT_676373 [Camillea tinctor]|nr:hypothetical protein F4810DRAFT_676373 [Camillea tinctor]
MRKSKETSLHNSLSFIIDIGFLFSTIQPPSTINITNRFMHSHLVYTLIIYVLYCLF